MASASLILPPSVTSLCPCSPTCTSIRLTPRSHLYRQFRSGDLIRRREHKALRLGTDFLDSSACKRLTENAGLENESSKRLQRTKAGVARAGLPVVSSVPVLGPVMNAIFNPVILMIIYLAGALYVASKAYRTNFKKAVL